MAALFSAHVISAQITIAAARAQGPGATVTVRGLVTNGAEFGNVRYLQDNTAGIALFSATAAPSIFPGDSVEVTGTLVDFNGLLEFSPVTAYTIINSGNPLPAPVDLLVPQLGETYEGQIVQVDQVTFLLGGGVFAGNTSYTYTDPNGVSSTIFVRNGSPLIGQLIPTGQVSLIGILSQFQVNYQILLRSINDIITGPGIQIITPLSTTGIGFGGFQILWETDIPGTSAVKYGLTPDLELGEFSETMMVTQHDVQLTGLESGVIYFCQAYSVNDVDTAWSAVRPFGTESNSTGSIKVYFNTTPDTTVATGQNAMLLYQAIDDTLINYINRAERTLDLTIYDFNNSNISNISDAINAAYNRGVRVRFISDGSLQPTNFGMTDLIPEIQQIQSPTGGVYGIMHNKFVIIDADHEDPTKPIVWTGSTNWTDRQINRDPNSVVILQDQTLARAYTIEFNQMWGDTGAFANIANAKFGPNKLDVTPHEFKIGGRRVECYFSPSDGTNNQILNNISTANYSVDIASMLITRSDIASALVTESNGGLDVRIVVDDSTSTTQWNTLSAGLPQGSLVANSDTTIIMHHKFMVVDHDQLNSDPLVWVGSHNWTSSANSRNDENSLVIHDALIANLYYQEFMGRFENLPTGPTGIDNIPPVITCPADVEIEVMQPQNLVTVQVGAPEVTDNVGIQDVVNNYNFTGNASGFYGLGSTPITWTVTDPTGNQSSCTMNVIVVQIPDTIAPIVSCTDDIMVSISEPATTAAIVMDPATGNDNVGIASIINSFNNTGNADGNYPVGTTAVVWTITDINGNQSTCTVNVTVELLTGVEEVSSNLLSVYPVPVSSGSRLTLSNAPKGISQLRILDLSGKIVMENNRLNVQGNTVDLGNINVKSGVYFIQLVHGSSVLTKRFVVVD